MGKQRRMFNMNRKDVKEKPQDSQNVINVENIKTGIYKEKFKKWNEKVSWSEDFTQKASALLTEDAGFLEPGEDEISAAITQETIVNSVDITSATKRFDLNLEFGSYRCKYSRNGRYLLLGGRKGHVSSMDWMSKKLYCEMNVMEEVFDMSYLHQETMFAVAQAKWVYIYDSNGIELHALKVLNKVSRLEFLPYHFLLASASEMGYLSWLDVSIGKMVAQFNTKLGRLNIMTQNPYNAILCCGHARDEPWNVDILAALEAHQRMDMLDFYMDGFSCDAGVVTMWSPNVRTPVAKMLVHEQPLSAIAIDTKGTFLATSDTNRHLKIWDIRMLDGPIQSYFLRSSVTNLAFSQKGLLAVSLGNVAEVYTDPCTKEVQNPYLRHSFTTPITNLNFCPFEDVLGVGHGKGFSSLLIPGSGEPNFDALEANQFQSKRQRREAEVKSLLEKIQPELITLNPDAVYEVHVPTVKDKIEAKKKLAHLKPPKINLDVKRKKKGGSVKVIKTKKRLQEEANLEFNRVYREKQHKAREELYGKEEEEPSVPSVLDRFKKRKKRKMG